MIREEPVGGSADRFRYADLGTDPVGSLRTHAIGARQ
jgi:hypothetical protein